MPSELESALHRNKLMLLAHTREASSEMVRVYGASWERLRGQITALHAEISAQGTPPSYVQLMRDARFRGMQDQIEGELRKFVPYANGSVISQQREAIISAERDAVQAITMASDEAVLARLSRMNPKAVEAVVGYASDGSPLRELFDAIGPDIAPRMIETLAHGVALGTGSRVVARQMRAQYGLGLTRALTIARTETMRAYRDAMHATYEANDDIIDGWVWMASVTIRSCPACIALHGSLHSLNEKLTGHPNCRCVAAPHVKGTSIKIESGESRFKKLSADKQKEILGPSKYAAYKDGNLSMTPFGDSSIVGKTVDARWGSAPYPRSLVEIVGAEKAKAYKDALKPQAQTVIPQVVLSPAEYANLEARVQAMEEYVAKKKAGLPILQQMYPDMAQNVIDDIAQKEAMLAGLKSQVASAKQTTPPLQVTIQQLKVKARSWKEFNDVDEGKMWIEGTFGDTSKIRSMLSNDEGYAVNRYQGMSYASINGALRKGELHDAVADLDSALTKFVTDRDIVTFRGGYIPKVTEALKAGQDVTGIEFQDLAFVSTTIDEKVARGFNAASRPFLKVRVPQGSKVIPYAGMKDGLHYQEAEILLERGTRFRVVSVEEVANNRQMVTVEVIK